MKTAAEMRALNPKFITDAILKEVENKIEEMARTGQTSLRFSIATSHPNRFKMINNWVYAPVVDSPEGVMMASIVRELEAAGYTVKAHYEDRQFVDIDIIISWDVLAS